MQNDNPTPQPDTEKEKFDQDQAKLKLRAWGLFGQLVMRGVIPPPETDVANDAEYQKVGEDLHATIMGLMLSLEGIDYLWATT